MTPRWLRRIWRHLAHPAELEVIRKLAEWPRLVEIAAKGNEPHRVAFYLYELASDFHGLWNSGNDDDSLRFLQEDTANLCGENRPCAGRGRCHFRRSWYPWRYSGRGNALIKRAPAVVSRHECRGGRTAPQAGAADGGCGL